MRIYFLVFSFFIVGCFRSEKNIGSLKNPLVIGFSYPYYQNLGEVDFLRLKNRLESSLKIKIEFKTIRESVEILEEIGRKNIDISFLTLNEYLIAREYYKVEPRLKVIRDGEGSYYGVIATVHKDIKSVEMLDGKKIATRSPYSFSGFILPSIVFSKLKIKPIFVFTDSFELALDKLKNGEVDAVSGYKSIVEKDKTLRIVNEFGPIPNEPVVCRKGLDDFLCGRVINELIKMISENDFKPIFKKMADITGFEEVTTAEYKELHKVLKENQSAIYKFVPEGIRIKKLSEEYRID